MNADSAWEKQLGNRNNAKRAKCDVKATKTDPKASGDIARCRSPARATISETTTQAK